MPDRGLLPILTSPSRPINNFLFFGIPGLQAWGGKKASASASPTRRLPVLVSVGTYAVAGPEGSRVKRQPNQSPDTPGEEPRLERSGDREIEHTQPRRKTRHRRRVSTPELDDRAWITPSKRGEGRAGKPLALAMGSLTSPDRSSSASLFSVFRQKTSTRCLLNSTTKNAAKTPQINKRNRLPLSALRCHRDRLSTTILAPFLAVV